MANVKIELNRGSVRDLLRSNEMRRDLEERGRRIAGAAGPGHRVDSDVGPNRVRVAVITDTADARRGEATGRTLTRALDAGR